mgnify:CR=1 FL=1
MTNWPEILANAIATDFDDVPVFSNVDPTREYNGGKTIEFNVQNVKTVPVINGSVYYDFQMIAACRAPSYNQALALLITLRELLQPLFRQYITEKSIVSAFFQTVEVQADARGLVEGESFYGLLNFTITENERG